MADIDELDRIWREGLSSAAAAMTPATDPTTRVAERVRRRRRARRTITATGVFVTGLVVVVAGASARSPHRDQFAASSPVAVVRVEVLVGGQLAIRIPGRASSGRPPRVELPSGVIRFEVRSLGGSDRLVIDGVPRFVAVLDPPYIQPTVTAVRIAPGTYVMHSTIPGHAEAGEEAILIVK